MEEEEERKWFLCLFEGGTVPPIGYRLQMGMTESVKVCTGRKLIAVQLSGCKCCRAFVVGVRVSLVYVSRG